MEVVDEGGQLRQVSPQDSIALLESGIHAVEGLIVLMLMVVVIVFLSLVQDSRQVFENHDCAFNFCFFFNFKTFPYFYL